MNQQKIYKFAGYTFKTYFKPAGNGYEVGLTSGNTRYFVGNFIHDKEAKKWWSHFNKSVTNFYRDFEYSEDAPRDFYGQFMSHFLYKEYYNFLSKMFKDYNNFYGKSYTKYSKKYDKMMRTMAA